MHHYTGSRCFTTVNVIHINIMNMRYMSFSLLMIKTYQQTQEPLSVSAPLPCCRIGKLLSPEAEHNR